MNTRKTGALLTAVLAGTIALAACGDQQAAQDTQGGYASGWQPGSYAPVPRQQLVEGVDSGIRAALVQKAARDAMPKDGWHARLLVDDHTRSDTEATRFQHRFE